jgi:poly-gamma-glutamate capsule biosynthesis protein CapA/YwtB (metallophosphatase superfamily)
MYLMQAGQRPGLCVFTRQVVSCGHSLAGKVLIARHAPWFGHSGIQMPLTPRTYRRPTDGRKSLLWLCVVILGIALSDSACHRSGIPTPSAVGQSDTVRLLATGDVNLGRKVGQIILSGDTLYPFQLVRDVFSQYDLVFANLESQLSDQDGETESPTNNRVFTGPPQAAWSLRLGGIDCVSLANNHTGDYGRSALRQTIDELDRAGIAHVGATLGPREPSEPLILERRGIRFAFFACTAIIPGSNPWWGRFIAEADSAVLFPRIREVRPLVDFIVVSYHGGTEYADTASGPTRAFAAGAIESGADLFLGHHPHVPYGITEIRGRYCVASLGNFVFEQTVPQWTMYSFGFAAQIVKDSSGTRIHAIRVLPLRSRLQPEFLAPGPEADMVLDRIRRQSNLPSWLIEGPSGPRGGF